MPKNYTQDFLNSLPFSLREEINGYGQSIYAVANDIIKEAGVRFTDELRDQLVFLACVRKLWAKSKTQFWILDNSLSLCRQNNISHIKMGGHLYGCDSEEYNEIRTFLRHFEELLRNLEIYEIIELYSLQEIVLFLVGRD